MIFLCQVNAADHLTLRREKVYKLVERLGIHMDRKKVPVSSLKLQRVGTQLSQLSARLNKSIKRCNLHGIYEKRHLKTTRNTYTQQPLVRFPNLFSVLTVILLINMPIPSKFNSRKIYAIN